MEIKDLLIIGDSFCSDRTKKYSWPQVLAAELLGTKYDSHIPPRGKGFSGGSWWAYRKILIEELKIHVPKVLIICHTEPFRLPNDNDYGLNFASSNTQSNINFKIPLEIQKTAELYYKHLFSFEFYTWAALKWFEEIDQLCNIYNIEKVIHFYCFDGEYTNYTFKTGVTIDPPLIEYKEEPRIKIWKFKSSKANHFTPEGNTLFGKKLAEIVTNYPGNGKRISERMIDYGNNCNRQ